MCCALGFQGALLSWFCSAARFSICSRTDIYTRILSRVQYYIFQTIFLSENHIIFQAYGVQYYLPVNKSVPKTTYHLQYKTRAVLREAGQRNKVVQTIPFVNATRDDDARSCPDTTVHASSLQLNRSRMGCLPMPVLPFCKPASHRVPRQTKMDPQARPCSFLNFGYNLGSDCFKITDAETGRIVHSRDVTWHQPREPLISPAPTVGSGAPHLSSGAETPDHVYIHPTPAAAAAAPATAAPQPSPYPRRYQPPQYQFPIALFGN